MSDYKKLRKAIKKKYIFKEREVIEDFKDVNEKIKEITNNDVEKIKSLICRFEGKLNKANYLMVITIGFALVICVFSLFGNSLDKEKDAILINILSLFLLVITLYVLYESVSEKKNGYKDTFILKALNFKLDELNNKDESSKETSKTPDTVIGGNIMSKEHEIKKFCDELSDDQANKVDYVRKKLKEKYKDNTDIYLMIKAEAKEDDGMQNLVFKVSFLALIFTSFDCIRGLLPDMGTILNSLINVVLLLVIVYLVIRIVWRDNSDSVYKWRKYILVVIDDLIEESKKSTVTDETDQIDIPNEGNTENEQGN